MIVVITSWAPVRALSTPGIAPYAAPPNTPARIASGICTNPGPSIMNPTKVEAKPPAIICPVAPMLNNPARNATATETPVKINGVELLMVFEIA